MTNLGSFDEEILHVYGSLIPDHTGSIHWLDKNLEVVSHTDRFFPSNIHCVKIVRFDVYMFVLSFLKNCTGVQRRENQ